MLINIKYSFMIFSLKQVKQIQQGLQKLLGRGPAMNKTPNQSAVNSPRRVKYLKPTISYRLKHQPNQPQPPSQSNPQCTTNPRKNSKTLVDAFLNTLMTTNRFDCQSNIDLNQLRSKSMTNKKEAQENLLNMRIYIGGKPEENSKSQIQSKMKPKMKVNDVIPSDLKTSIINASRDQSENKQGASKIINESGLQLKEEGVREGEEEFKILKPSDMQKHRLCIFKQPLKIQIQNGNNTINATGGTSKEMERQSSWDYMRKISLPQNIKVTQKEKDKKNEQVGVQVHKNRKTINRLHVRTEEEFLIHKYNYQINQKENPTAELLKNKYKNLDKRLEMIKKVAIQNKPKAKIPSSIVVNDHRKQLQNYKRYSPLTKLYEFNNILRSSSTSPLKH